MGIAVPPSGLKLLNELDKDLNLEQTSLDEVENKLQTFVGHNLLKSVSLRKNDDRLTLEITQPMSCADGHEHCRQYPCPTCSAVLTALTRAAKEKIWIQSISNHGDTITFNLKIGE